MRIAWVPGGGIWGGRFAKRVGSSAQASLSRASGLQRKRIGDARVDGFSELDAPGAALPDGVRVRKHLGSQWNRHRSRSRRRHQGKLEDFGESWSRPEVDGSHQAVVAVRARLILERFEGIWLHRDRVDFRKSVDGLAAIVEQEMGLDVFGPHLFLFCDRRRRRMKVLYWDRTGFALWYKRLEREKFV